MIFISGVHGVGKSYFCNLLKERLGISAYTASQLITDAKQSGFSTDKKVTDIDQNQLYLLEAVENLRNQGTEFLLDGHFCLLNINGDITRIPEDTFTQLKPDAIVLLTEDPYIIASVGLREITWSVSLPTLLNSKMLRLSMPKRLPKSLMYR